jgi:hypothetical protein
MEIARLACTKKKLQVLLMVVMQRRVRAVLEKLRHAQPQSVWKLLDLYEKSYKSCLWWWCKEE